MKFEKTQVPHTACRPSAVRTRDQDDPHDDAHPEGENSAKRQKTSEYEAYVSGESSFGQVNVEEPGPSTSDEEIPLQSDIVFGSRNGNSRSPHPRKITPLVSKLSKRFLNIQHNLRSIRSFVLEEREETEGKFNPYARYGVENWKNPHAKIFYIRRQKEPERPKEEIYSNSKIVQVIKTYWELGHEHKFITEIVARRANDCIVSITEPDYKNLNKNDIEDMYLLIMNNKKINLTAPTITFLGIEEYDVFSIVYEPVHGIIYTNSKKEKRVMRPSEIHKFCDATLRRTLEGLKSYYNDVKYGYVQKELTNDEVEFLKLFEEEIEVRLNYRDQMRRWEMYVNGRPLGPRRERPE
ncbi:hypothetical protein Tco_1352514 [Tanacetum coccineum]